MTFILSKEIKAWQVGACILVVLLAQQGAYGQQDSANPCLAHTAEDNSQALAVPSATSSTLQNNIIPEVQNSLAHAVSVLEGTKVISADVVLNPRNQADFARCLDSINDPSSPNYHHFLNSTTILPYLPTPGQKQSLVSFFSSHGFKVTDTTSPFMLKVSAPVSIHELTFGIKMRVYQALHHQYNFTGLMEQKLAHLRGFGSFYAPDSAPKLPANIASLISSIQGLDNYTRVIPLESPCSGPFCPQGIQVGYSLPKLHSNGLDGSGQNVAIVDCAGDPNPQSAVDTYDQQYGLPSTTLKIFYPNGTPSSYDGGWASETMMDIEAVHTVAPKATIDLIYMNCSSASPMDGIDYVATNHIASIVTNSWGFSCNNGACSDSQLTPSLVASSDNRLALDAAQGMTILFASGDQGATPDGTNLGTGYPASDPNVLAVGATDLSLSGCGTSNCTSYASEAGSQISGGGYSGYFAEPAWQTSAIGAKSGRGVPDVSMLGYKPTFWVYATSSDQCGRAFFSTAGWFGCAGTSLSSPLWAGYLAIVQQMKGGAMFGNIDPLLYKVYSNSSYSCAFHDVTSGNNIASGGKGYVAGPGWDPVTGLGTPTADNLAKVLNGGSCTVFTPEFGPEAIIILAVTIVGVILLGSRATGLHYRSG